jgi:hypothetical protein
MFFNSLLSKVIITVELVKLLIAFILLSQSIILYDNHVEFFCEEPSSGIKNYLSMIVLCNCLTMLLIYSYHLGLVRVPHVYDPFLIMLSGCQVFYFKTLIYHSENVYYCDSVVVSDFKNVLIDQGYLIVVVLISLGLRLVQEKEVKEEEEEERTEETLKEPLLNPSFQQEL